MRGTRPAPDPISNGADHPSSSNQTTRRSLRRFAYQENGRTEPAQQDVENGPASGNEQGTSLGKRKRNIAEDVINHTKAKAHRSPRKQETVHESKPLRKPRRQPAKHIKGPNGNVTVEAPVDWERVYNTTAAMRKRVLAPVDTMGCESLADTTRSPQDQRLQTLVSLMLSSQTKDTVTAAAMWNLQANLPGGFCLESLLQVEPEELNRLIEKVGFHNNKTKFIKATAIILRDQYNGDIPDTIESLVSLPGVGPKMAYLCMSAAWGRDEGIGVDVHVHRITNLWGWHKTATPEQTRAELEAWLPKDRWHAINHLLVGFGQTICLPVGRKCWECDLALEGLCPSAQLNRSPVKKKVEMGVEIKVEDGQVTMAEKIVTQSDGVGIKVEAQLDGEGVVEMQAFSGAG